jgi:hypothetical protein
MEIDTINKLLEISSRIEHMEKSAEWISRETVHSDNAVSQTGTLITVLADEIREKVCTLVKSLEKKIEYSSYH